MLRGSILCMYFTIYDCFYKFEKHYKSANYQKVEFFREKWNGYMMKPQILIQRIRLISLNILKRIIYLQSHFMQKIIFILSIISLHIIDKSHIIQNLITIFLNNESIKSLTITKKYNYRKSRKKNFWSYHQVFELMRYNHNWRKFVNDEHVAWQTLMKNNKNYVITDKFIYDNSGVYCFSVSFETIWEMSLLRLKKDCILHWHKCW